VTLSTWAPFPGNFPVPTIYGTQRQSLIFVGDSITWGYGLTRLQGFPAQLQAQVDSHQGHSGTGWEARAVDADDWSTTPYNGGIANPSGTTLLSAAGTLTLGTNDNVGPFSQFTYDTSGTSPFVYTFPGIGLGSSTANGFSFAANSAPYIVFWAIPQTTGSGSLHVFAAGNATPLTITYSFTVGVPVRFIATTPSYTSGTVAAIYWAAGVAVDIVTLHPTTLYSSNQVLVQVVARNSYAIADYVNATTQIQQVAIFTPAQDGSADAAPIYVLAIGTVSMYATGVSPATYQSQLDTIATALLAGNAAPNGVVLTIPLIPDPLAFSAPLSGTVGQYRDAVLWVAAKHQLAVVDLATLVPIQAGVTQLTTANGMYQSTSGSYGPTGSGLHPTATCATAMYNVYKSVLRL